MIKKKGLIFFLIFLILNNCSFDSKTGIWSGSEKEKRKISEIEKEQKQIIDIDKIYSSENAFSKEVLLASSIVISKPRKNSSWEVPGLNNQNYLGNIYLPNANNIFFKKKIGKNKFSTSKIMTTLLISKNNIIFSDDTGTVFNIRDDGKINWKINIYKKLYKKIYKSLVYSIYKNNIYIADNIGFIYVINIKTGKVIWIKNYGVPLKSTIKVFDDKIFLTDQDNRIICLKISDGSKIWDIVSISSFIKSQNLLSLAVTKNGDLISINSAADIFKIKGDSGEIYWSRNTSDTLYAHDLDFFISSDIVIDENEIFFSAGQSIFSYNIDNGNVNWQNEVSSAGAPIVDKKNIFFVSENGYFVILDKNSGKIISSTNILKVLKKKKQMTKITGFIMGSGKIYAVTLNGYLIVSSALSGKVEYFKKIGDPIASAPIISNGKLYIITENSRIVGFN
tara:strand:- start:524 stop:1873 length:1350 start_codon:yes stop_codon:yes gene_type:complete